MEDQMGAFFNVGMKREEEEKPQEELAKKEEQKEETKTEETKEETQETQTEEENKVETVPENEEDDISPSDDDSTAIIFSKFLRDSGTLTDVNEDKLKERYNEIGDAALAELFANEVKKEAEKMHNERVSSLTPEKQELLEYMETGASDAKEFAELQKQDAVISQITKESLEGDVKLQKQVVMQAMIARGSSEAQIKRRLDRYDKDIAAGTEEDEAYINEDLFADAIDDTNYLKAQVDARKAEKQRKAQEAKEAKEKEIADNIKRIEEITKTREETGGMKVSLNLRKNVEEMMRVPTASGTSQVLNVRAQNPLDWEWHLALYHQLGLFRVKDGRIDPDLSKLKAFAETTATKGLKDKLSRRQEGAKKTEDQQKTSASGWPTAFKQ